MSDSDDPFGRRDRTIIRPNPGGRRPAAPPAAGDLGPVPPPPMTPQPPYQPPQPYSPPPAYPSPPAGYPPAAGYPPQPGYPPPPGYPPIGAPAAGMAPPGWDDWTAAGGQPQANPYQAPRAPEPLMPAPSAGHVSIDLVGTSTQPMMRAASSLLLLLGRLRAALSRGGYAQLMDQVAQAIVQFEISIRDAGVPPEQVLVAKYALAATADDIVQNLPSDDRHLWTKYSMLARFFGERTGGVRFFTELDRAKQNPALNIGLLELMHACLSLGFEGVHRTSAGGAGSLQGIRRDLYETIQRVRSKTIEDLSPHWRGQDIAIATTRNRVPTWSIAALAAVLLLGAYILLRNLLSGEAEIVAAKLAALTPSTDVAIAREVFTPPPPDPPAPPPPDPGVLTQLQRIRAALAPEILAEKVAVEQTSTSIIIRIGNLALFQSGQAKVIESFTPIAKRISETLEKEPGKIRIDGYSDNVPIKTVTFPSNWELSEARAKAVAALLKTGLTDPARLEVTGKGAENPVASNDTPEGRAKNRRVEISIPRAD